MLTVLWPFTFKTDSQLDEPLERFAFGLVLVIPMTIAFFLLAGGVLALMQRGSRVAFSRFRLERFAQANGFSYLPKATLEDDSEVYDLLRSQGEASIEIGNYYAPVPGSKAGGTIFAFGYVAVQLQQPMPHIVLDSTRNDIAISLAASLARGQQLSLEGDFDRHFKLFCANGYERDALYIFTPDVMASFIDGAATLEAEFRGDVLVLYSAEQLSTLNPERWRLVSTALGAVLPRLTSWGRWRESIWQPTDAPSGMEDTSQDVPLISRLELDPETTPLKRRTPLWVRLTVIGVVGYGLALISLLVIFA